VEKKKEKKRSNGVSGQYGREDPTCLGRLKTKVKDVLIPREKRREVPSAMMGGGCFPAIPMVEGKSAKKKVDSSRERRKVAGSMEVRPAKARKSNREWEEEGPDSGLIICVRHEKKGKIRPLGSFPGQGGKGVPLSECSAKRNRTTGREEDRMQFYLTPREKKKKTRAGISPEGKSSTTGPPAWREKKESQGRRPS